MNHAIYLRHKSKLILPAAEGPPAPAHLATLLKNIEALGFTFSPRLVGAAERLPADALIKLYGELVPALRELVGAHVRFAPMYPDFPRQVMEMEPARLYLNAIIHYISGALPVYPSRERPPLLDRVDLRVIDLGDEEDFRQVGRNLIGSKVAIAPADRRDVDWFIRHYRDALPDLLPAAIPAKENLAYVAALVLEHAPGSLPLLTRFIKTATDVLRVAVALSGGDVSLAAPTRFRSFRRAERRLLLGLLDQCAAPVEDMLRFKQPWIRLGERLHPGEYAKAYPQAAAAFAAIRNDLPVPTFNSSVERALAARDVAAACALLERRPGELARRLDHLLRLGGDSAAVLAAFRAAAPRVATPVLLQVQAHFKQRGRRPALRTFFPKGAVAKAWAIDNRLPELAEDRCAAAVAICRETLIERFAGLAPLGPTYVDERLKQYVVPFAQRSASKALRTLVRGSRLPLGDGGTVRFFLWWREGIVSGKPTGTVDIDLSAVMYDAEWRYKEHISYTNLKSATYNAAHSGDITQAPFGACEFIDLDVDSVLRYGGRYVVMSINSYSRQPFCDLPECFAGWMQRQHPNSGEIFDPRTVVDKVDLAADTRVGLPVILDLAERTVIWADLALKHDPRWHNNVEGNRMGMVLMGKALTTLAKPNLYDLFELHALARGTPAPREAAQTIFAPDAGVTPFDTGVIMAEYL